MAPPPRSSFAGQTAFVERRGVYSLPFLEMGLSITNIIK